MARGQPLDTGPQGMPCLEQGWMRLLACHVPTSHRELSAAISQPNPTLNREIAWAHSHRSSV